MNFLGVHFAWAFNLCFARSICPSGVQCLRRSRGKVLGCLPFTFNPSPLTFSSICASHVQFALRAFNAFGVQGGRSFGCLAVIPLHRYTVTPLHRYTVTPLYRYTVIYTPFRGAIHYVRSAPVGCLQPVISFPPMQKSH